jgi:hypothetical protein
MSVIELKTEFHKLIDSVENEARLQDLYDSVAFYLGQESDLLNENSPEMISNLKSSLSQAESGKTISTEQLKQEITQWLSKSIVSN